MYVLADCNNFYASCERAFDPKLINVPLVVLSGNDGCIIARSNEAKAVGIPMGAPLFKVRELISKHNVVMRSTNFALYGDMSMRVMMILKQFAPSIEVYSIDEAFMDFSGTQELFDLENYTAFLSKYIYRATGIPVSFGIAPTKTLAKLASKLAKTNSKTFTYKISGQEQINEILKVTPVGEIWGIGRKVVEKLHKYGVYSALEFANKDRMFFRTMFSVLMERTQMELKGIPCYEFENMPSARESISSSRSFLKDIGSLDSLREILAHFVSNVHSKLIKQNSICSEMTVYIQTNRFSKNYYFNSRIKYFDPSTDSLLELTSAATSLLNMIFHCDYEYKKCGVILSKISPKSGQTVSLFDNGAFEKNSKLNDAINNVNKLFGKETLVSARKGFGDIPIRKDNISPQYTTRWEDIIVVNCDM